MGIHLLDFGVWTVTTSVLAGVHFTKYLWNELACPASFKLKHGVNRANNQISSRQYLLFLR